MSRHHDRCVRGGGAEAFGLLQRRLTVSRFKEILESGKLGTVTAIATPRGASQNHAGGRPHGASAEHSGGGLFLDLGSHALDLLDYLVRRSSRFPA